MTRTQRASVLSTLFLGLSLAGQVVGATTNPGTQPVQQTQRSGPQPIAAQLFNLPIQFEANQGQVDESVKFLARGSGYTLFLTPTESVMVLQQREATSQISDQAGHDPLAMPEPAPMKQAVVRTKLEGAHPSPTIDGIEKLPGIVNYFVGNDPAKWRTNIPTYAKVLYKGAYPGIDLAYYGNQGKQEYDFIVSPGADPSQIKLAFEGASDIVVANSGELILITALGEVRLQKPMVYQVEKDGHKTVVAGNYAVRPESAMRRASRTTNHAIGIELAAYDRQKSLVIDPVIVYSSFIGGAGQHNAPRAIRSYEEGSSRDQVSFHAPGFAHNVAALCACNATGASKTAKSTITGTSSRLDSRARMGG